MTWWPSVPTSAVMAPTIAGSSSTTRIRSGRGHGSPPTATRRAGRASTKLRPARLGRLAPQPRAHRLGQALGRVQADPGTARRVRVAPGVRLEDPLPPLVRDARPLVADDHPGDALDEAPRRRASVVSGGAYLTAFSTRCSTIWRRRGASARAWSRRRPVELAGGGGGAAAPGSRPSRPPRGPRRPGATSAGWSGTTRTEARIESTSRSSRSTCSSAAAMPRRPLLTPGDVARRPALQRRFLRQQVGVGADHRERRAQLVGHEGDQLAPRLVDAPGARRRAPRPRLLAALLDDAGQQVGDRAKLGDVAGREVARLLGLDVEDADDLVVPGERHGQHRGDEAPLVDAADPQEARVGADVRDDQRLAGGGDAAGDALAERHPGAADLVAVQAVRGRQRQVRAVAVEQVERRDVGVEGVARLVDDRLEQLVPRPRRRGQAGHAVQEAQLLELLHARGRGADRIDHHDHDTNGTKAGRA